MVVEARTVPGAGEFPVRKMPCRVIAASTRPAPDVAVLTLQLPANDALQYRAGQYVEFILRDGARRSYSMANAPHTQSDKPGIELHIRHMPGGKFTDHVFGAMKEKEILRLEGPFGSFFLREDSDKPIVLLAAAPASRRSRRSSSTCSSRASRGPRCCTGAAAARPTCTCTTGPMQAARRAAEPALRAGAVGAAAAKTAGPAAPASSTRR